ncbi:MAG: Ppx/GppA phosphatase [Anaerolineales bacterium]|jgi:exopolyphosphatase/guanosine-5'-triphosphate,3'-diphosphate pyrophosphatase|nr:Ppx/GppA phosphatase [Anaerolineales bacterium]
MVSPVPLKRRLGIIDLGSNSARLIIVRYTPGVAFKVTDELSRRVRLGEGMVADNRLRPAAMERAIDAVNMFRAFCQANAVAHLTPVATAAVRDAVNRAEFLARLHKSTGLKFRVLTGEEEAYFGVLGVINSMGLRAGLVMDVGGGSTEVSEVRKGRFRRGVTSPLGAVRLTELYLDGDPVRASEAARLADHVFSTFKMLDWMKVEDGEKLVGLGGTLRALARIDREMRDYPLGLTHGYELELDRLDELIERVRKLPLRERLRKVPGLQPDRADIILAGAVVVAEALRRAGADRMTVCGQGLREGLFYREFLKPADPPVVHNLREFSVLNLGRLYGFDKAHVDHVARLALSLFDQLSKQHGYGEPEREYLWAASQLHDIGTIVDYYDHHKHSAYIVVSTGLPGYSHRETVLIALLGLYHRKGEPDVGPYRKVLEAGDAERVRRLAALLRLAEYLDRSRTQAVTRLRIQAGDKRVRLWVKARGRAEGRVEVWEAQRNASLFEQAFGCKLEIEQE